ncbi:hypothetical protein HDU93_009687 [Gonapodya sp. JEL0774]|nr:hypothetical protein HDU93_009687 [Gonapodya sp. JEL0774]
MAFYRTVLYGPATILIDMAIYLILRPRWMKRNHILENREEVLGGVSFDFDEGFLRKVILEWAASPAFVAAFEHAMATAQTLEAIEAYQNVQPMSSNCASMMLCTRRTSGPLGDLEGLILSPSVIVLVIGAAITKSAIGQLSNNPEVGMGHLLRMAGVIMRMMGVEDELKPGFSWVEVIVEWVKGKLAGER